MLQIKLTRVITILTIWTGLALASSPPTTPELFPPEIKWAVGSDASPAFMPDGKTVYFTHSRGEKCSIMVSHLRYGAWSEPKVASFSGQWRDIEPAMAPDGSYLLFISNRPAVGGGTVLNGYWGGEEHPGKGGNLWRVDRVGDDWSKPVRLPDVVNSNSSIYAPAVARNGGLYFTQPDPKTKKARLYRSQFTAGTYGAPEPLSFSDGLISDFDPVVAPDESFIIFSSVRPPTPEKKAGMFVAFSDGHHWKTPIAFKPFLIGIESRLSPDLKTLYFTTDRPTLETFPAAQNPSANSGSAIPEQIWQISLELETMASMSRITPASATPDLVTLGGILNPDSDDAGINAGRQHRLL